MRFFLLILLLFLSLITFAQTGADTTALYKKHTASADSALALKNYSAAMDNYLSALKYKPMDHYSRTQLSKIPTYCGNNLLSEKYHAAIARGDKALSEMRYRDARTCYIEASALKPQEHYPKNKVEELDQLIPKICDTKQYSPGRCEAPEDIKFKNLIEEGDKYFANANYRKAKTVYKEASLLKPNEEYPKNKISQIDKLEYELSYRENSEYQKYVKQGDSLLNLKNYAAAKKAYTDALKIKPEEQYPKDKLKEFEVNWPAPAKQK